jgi:hypothetical protein
MDRIPSGDIVTITATYQKHNHLPATAAEQAGLQRNLGATSVPARKDGSRSSGEDERRVSPLFRGTRQARRQARSSAVVQLDDGDLTRSSAPLRDDAPESLGDVRVLPTPATSARWAHARLAGR